MKFKKFAPQKNTAQAMVEFAIVLPLLLLLLYGLLEVGRLLFIYSSTVTASRQAVRYGATTGDGTTPGVPRFLDCAGIRQAANRVDYLNAFDHTTDDVQIFWDTGPGTTQSAICAPGLTSENVWTGPGTTNNTIRLVVRVEGQFNPIVRLVPLPQRDIKTTSARTILMSVPIAVSGSGADTTAMILDLNPHRDPPDGPPHSDVGEPVTVTVAITNQTGTATPTGTVNFIIRNTDTNTVVTTCSSPL